MEEGKSEGGGGRRYIYIERERERERSGEEEREKDISSFSTYSFYIILPLCMFVLGGVLVCHLHSSCIVLYACKPSLVMVNCFEI